MKDQTTKEIIQHGADNIADMIQNNETIDRDDLHNRLYNEDYYTIGTHKAMEELKVYGTFEAIGKVSQYEKDQFGESNSDLSNPEIVVNMLAYIIGEEALNESKTFQAAEGELSTEQLEAIKTELEEQAK